MKESALEIHAGSNKRAKKKKKSPMEQKNHLNFSSCKFVYLDKKFHI